VKGSILPLSGLRTGNPAKRSIVLVQKATLSAEIPRSGGQDRTQRKLASTLLHRQKPTRGGDRNANERRISRWAAPRTCGIFRARKGINTTLKAVFSEPTKLLRKGSSGHVTPSSVDGGQEGEGPVAENSRVTVNPENAKVGRK